MSAPRSMRAGELERLVSRDNADHSRAVPPRHRILYDSEHGHVCTCSELEPYRDDAGEAIAPNYRHTVEADRTVEPTESGSWLYYCSRCGTSAWSGC